mmetsp:Transcript_132422/g.423887  ORF Transcript_132422/g.423887 Transcript_132422/m.423887 type:complete len:278 (+) Transcript_132422:1505-2338(+)
MALVFSRAPARFIAVAFLSFAEAKAVSATLVASLMRVRSLARFCLVSDSPPAAPGAPVLKTCRSWRLCMMKSVQAFVLVLASAPAVSAASASDMTLSVVSFSSFAASSKGLVTSSKHLVPSSAASTSSVSSCTNFNMFASCSTFSLSCSAFRSASFWPAARMASTRALAISMAFWHSSRIFSSAPVFASSVAQTCASSCCISSKFAAVAVRTFCTTLRIASVACCSSCFFLISACRRAISAFRAAAAASIFICCSCCCFRRISSIIRFCSSMAFLFI